MINVWLLTYHHTFAVFLTICTFELIVVVSVVTVAALPRKLTCIIVLTFALFYYCVLYRSVFQGSYVRRKPRPQRLRDNSAASVMKHSGAFAAAVTLLLSIFSVMQCPSFVALAQ